MPGGDGKRRPAAQLRGPGAKTCLFSASPPARALWAPMEEDGDFEETTGPLAVVGAACQGAGRGHCPPRRSLQGPFSSLSKSRLCCSREEEERGRGSAVISEQGKGAPSPTPPQHFNPRYSHGSASSAASPTPSSALGLPSTGTMRYPLSHRSPVSCPYLGQCHQGVLS